MTPNHSHERKPPTAVPALESLNHLNFWAESLIGNTKQNPIKLAKPWSNYIDVTLLQTCEFKCGGIKHGLKGVVKMTSGRTNSETWNLFRTALCLPGSETPLRPLEGPNADSYLEDGLPGLGYVVNNHDEIIITYNNPRPGVVGLFMADSYLEDHPRYRKWLGSPPCISHKKAIWKGNNLILRGLTITMVINHLQVLV